jgi:formate/nitrite transporter FocA (FNT family)
MKIKETHLESKIFKYQLVCITAGTLLLLSGLLSLIFLSSFSAFNSFLLILGSIGWFSASLLMSPMVRRDLFQDLFEPVEDEE